MPVIRANRDSVDDRFSVLGFSIRTEAPLYEVGIASDPELFKAENRAQRNRHNFYSSRGAGGVLRARRGEAVYLVPPDVMLNFIGQPQLYYGLATYAESSGGTPNFVQSPTAGNMYVKIAGLTERGLRRLTGRPGGTGSYSANGASLVWGGDAVSEPESTTPTLRVSNGSEAAAPIAANGARAANGSSGLKGSSGTTGANGSSGLKASNGASAANAPKSSNGATRADGNVSKLEAAPTEPSSTLAPSTAPPATVAASLSYDDGFGEFPVHAAPRQQAPRMPAGAARSTFAARATTGARALAEEDEGDQGEGITGPIPDDDDTVSSTTQGVRALDVTPPEYPGASRFAPAHRSNYKSISSTRTIDHVVIHITDGGSKITGTIGWFQNPDQRNARNQPIHVSAHYVIGQDGEVVQMVRNNDVAWHASAANAHSVGIEHVANKRGLVPTEAQYEASAKLVAWLCSQFNVPPDRDHIQGHQEISPRDNHDCPSKMWDWDHYMDLVSAEVAAAGATSADTAQALGMSAQARTRGLITPPRNLAPVRAKSLGARPTLVSKAVTRARSSSLGVQEAGVADIKLRVFIPSPAIIAPHTPLHPLSGRTFVGDGRGFQEDGGTSRCDLHAKFQFAQDGGHSTLTVLDRRWGQTIEYDPDDTVAVDGKPDWYRALKSGAKPIDQGQVSLSDDNLRIAMGGTDYSEDIASIADNSAVLGVTVDGSDPLVWYAPAIDANLNLHLKIQNGRMMVRIHGTHDAFPAYELYVNSQLLYSFDPIAAGTTPLALVGAGQFDVQVETDWVDVGPASEYRMIPVHIKGAAQALANQSFSIHWDDTPYQPQSNDHVCWAATAAMVVGWRDRVCIPDEAIADKVPIIDAFLHGLAPKNRITLADAWNLVAEPPASYSVEGFHQMLQDYGPLYVGMKWDKSGGGHARVLVGMESDGNPDGSGTTMFMYDPWPDTPGRIRMAYNDFVDLYEGRMTSSGGVVDVQIMHADSAAGRTPATAAPFSLSLAASQVRPRTKIPAHASMLSAQASAPRSRGGGARSAAAIRPLETTSIDNAIALIPQPDKLSCWAAAMTMLLSYRRQASYTPESLANEVGQSLMQSYGWDLLTAVRTRYGFTAIEVPSNTSLYLDPAQWAQWLQQYGPLWVVIVGMPHAVVIAGLRGDTADASSVEVHILNPWDTRIDFDNDPIAFNPRNQGYDSWQPFSQFAADFGNMAEPNYGNWRILHLPAAAPVAQSLGAAARARSRWAAPPPKMRARALDATEGESAIDPTRIPGTTMSTRRGQSGRVRWQLDQLKGLKSPDTAPAVVGAELQNVLTLDQWPAYGTDAVPLPLTVRWTANGSAAGNVCIEPGTATAPNYDVEVTATIDDDLDPVVATHPTVATLKVIVEYRFRGTPDGDRTARADLRLYGNGSHDRDSRWL